MENFVIALIALVVLGLLWAFATWLCLELGESGAEVRRALEDSKRE